MGEMADFYIEQHMSAFPDDFWVRKESARPVCKYRGMRKNPREGRFGSGSLPSGDRAGAEDQP